MTPIPYYVYKELVFLSPEGRRAENMAMVLRFRKPSAEAVHNLIVWIQSRAFNDAGVIIGIARSSI